MNNMFDAQREFDQDPNPMTAHLLSIALRRAGMTGQADSVGMLGRIMAGDIIANFDNIDAVIRHSMWHFNRQKYVSTLQETIIRMVNRILYLNRLLSGNRAVHDTWNFETLRDMDWNAEISERNILSAELAAATAAIYIMDPTLFSEINRLDPEEIIHGSADYGDIGDEYNSHIVPVRVHDWLGVLQAISHPSSDINRHDTVIQRFDMPDRYFLESEEYSKWLLQETPSEQCGDVSYLGHFSKYESILKTYMTYVNQIYEGQDHDEQIKHPSINLVADVISLLQDNPEHDNIVVMMTDQGFINTWIINQEEWDRLCGEDDSATPWSEDDDYEDDDYDDDDYDEDW